MARPMRTVLHLAAAALVAVAAGAALPLAPTAAATCATANGVSVVVDFHELGGGVQSACVADGAGVVASTLLPQAGFPLSYVQRQPGFVCRVSGKPADDPCVNTPSADAYWSLWWSDGTSGTWTFSTLGVGGLKVPAGGYVALSWQGSSGRSQPGIAPVAHATATPTPTKAPTPKPTEHSTGHSTGHSTAHSTGHASGHPSSGASPTSSATSSASGSASPGDGPAKPAKSKHPTSSAPTATSSDPSTSPEADDDAVPVSSDPADPDGGLPTWVAPVVIVLLFGAAGGVLVVRRRRHGT